MGTACCSIFDDADDADDEKKYKKQTTNKPLKLPPNTKRAIATAHLFAKIIYDYFNDDSNSCDIATFDVYSILEHVVLLGGATRDFIIGRSINDIDFTINNRELNKIQLLHLQKYHNNVSIADSDKSKCILWRHYLNKFNADQNNDNVSELRTQWQTNPKQEKAYFQNLDYILNAEFLMSILTNSAELKDKLQVNHNSEWCWYQFIINKKLIYDGINLEGQDCDILELKDRKQKKQQFNHKSSIQRFPSMQLKLFEQKIDSTKAIQNLSALNENEQENEEKEKKIVPISIPVYSVSLRDCFIHNDLSINCSYIQLSNCLGINYANELHDVINYDWTPYIKNATEMDSLGDIERKILTHSRPREMIKSQKPDRHFWRIVKFSVRMHDWKIDENLINEHKRLYKDWIGNEKWLADEKNESTIAYIPRFLFDHKTVKQWQRILGVYDLLDFNDIFVNALKSEYLKKCWIEKLNEMESDEKDEICELLRKRNYLI